MNIVEHAVSSLSCNAMTCAESICQMYPSRDNQHMYIGMYCAAHTCRAYVLALPA